MNPDIPAVYVLGGITIILMVTIIMMRLFYRTQQRKFKEKIEQQSRDIELQKELLSNTVKTQEIERERIAKELHDDITSKLSIIHLNVHLIKQQTDSYPKLAVITDRIETSLQQSIERSREMAHELLPQIFKKFGFHHALRELCHAINLKGVFTLTIEGEHHIPAADLYKLLHLYRILQELTKNSLQYANARQASILFEKKNNQTLEITYRDDGVGFDPNQPVSGLGISNIKTRVELLDGNISFHSRNGEGVLVILNIPELKPIIPAYK